MEASPVRLNLGCGHRLLDGWVNVDLAENWTGEKPDVSSDLRKLPFEDNYADVAMAIHVLEHFPLWETHDLLSEWVRVLKPGGKLIIEVPCFDKVVQFLKNDETNIRMTLYALYGNPSYRNEAMMHKWCFSRGLLKAFLKDHLVDVKEEEPQFHFKERDMRFVGLKGG